MKGVVAGLALAGGKSSRMGRDKALIRLPGEGGGEGPTMLERAYSLLSELTPRVWVSCAAGRPYTGYPCLFDEGAEAGPGAGILSGLRAAEAAGFSALLCLPCDLPFMNALSLRRLLATRETAPPHTLATLYASAESGLLEPLVAIYECAAQPFFRDVVASGRRRLFDIIPPERRHLLRYGRDEARAFFNMNSAEDLRAASVRPTG